MVWSNYGASVKLIRSCCIKVKQFYGAAPVLPRYNLCETWEPIWISCNKYWFCWALKTTKSRKQKIHNDYDTFIIIALFYPDISIIFAIFTLLPALFFFQTFFTVTSIPSMTTKGVNKNNKWMERIRKVIIDHIENVTKLQNKKNVTKQTGGMKRLRRDRNIILIHLFIVNTITLFVYKCKPKRGRLSCVSIGSI